MLRKAAGVQPMTKEKDPRLVILSIIITEHWSSLVPITGEKHHQQLGPLPNLEVLPWMRKIHLTRAGTAQHGSTTQAFRVDIAPHNSGFAAAQLNCEQPSLETQLYHVVVDRSIPAIYRLCQEVF